MQAYRESQDYYDDCDMKDSWDAMTDGRYGDTPEGNGEKRNVPQNVALTNGDVALNGENVPQNVAQTEADVAQMGVDVAQNLDDCIFTLILETPNIKREDMARRLSITKKTIERHLKDLGISWKGHPKTGHWVLPKKK